MERYREYKDSGVKWLGEIPSHWEVVRFGKHFKFRKGLSITKADLIETGIAVISYGQIHAKNNLGTTLSASLVRYVSQDYLQTHPQCLLTKNDFVFADTSEDIEGSGNFVYNDFKDTIFAGYHTIIAKQNGLYNPKYYAYLFLSESWKNNVRNLVNGVKVYSIGRKQLKDNFLLFPLSHEQDAIVRYLDTATSEIDKAIAMQQKMIDLLNERKQIIIQNAVTKGLDENVEMKESGVEWIGRIPKHWSKDKTMRMFGLYGSGTTPRENIEGGNIPWINSGDLNNSSLKVAAKYVSEKTVKEISALKVYPENSIIIAMYGASIGKISISKIECCTNQACFVLSYPYEKIRLEYAFYSLMTCKKKWIEQSQGGTQPNINADIIKQTWLALPPLKEQEEIVDFIEEKCNAIEKTIETISRQITLLQEHKQIIINEVVTGKVRVS